MNSWTPSAPWRLLRLGASVPPDLLKLSPVIAESVAVSVAAGEAPPTLVVRRQNPYVLLGPKDRRLPQLQAGIDLLQARGLPVFERIGGGSAVLLDETCLSFGVACPCRDLTLIERNFRELAEGVLRALRHLGLPAEFGAAPGSFCEGPYDVVVEGRKVAGIAQALRGGFTLVSGMLIISQDPVTTTDLLSRFYAAAGSHIRLRPAAVVSLSQITGRTLTVAEMETCLETGFADIFDLQAADLQPAETERARRLLAKRRIA